MKTNVRSKSTIKTNGKDGGKFKQNFKSKSYLTSSNTTSRLKQSVKKEKSKSSFKSVIENKDGSYTLQKGKDGGKFTSRKISKIRAKFIQRRMKKKRDKL